MTVALIISGLTCIALICSVLFFSKIKLGKITLNSYWVVCVVGAVAIVVAGCLSPQKLLQGLTRQTSVNPIEILILFISMTFLSVFLDEEGFFGYLAEQASKRAKASQTKLFFTLYLVVSILTVFTSNDIVILTFTPFICYFCKRSSVNPLPYLVAEFCAANTWSMMLIIGNPTNVYLATTAGISFLEYLNVMALPTVMAGVVQIAVLYMLFRKSLSTSFHANTTYSQLKDMPSLIIGIVHLAICLVMLVICSYAHIEMWMVCLICAISLAIFVAGRLLLGHKPFKPLLATLKRLPWDLIPFVLSMFTLVLALQQQGVTDLLSGLLSKGNTVLNYGISSFICCNLINNIPMSVLYSTFASVGGLKAVYATIIGSNVGAFLTPVGALAGIMFTDLVKKQQVKFSFVDFIKYGLTVSLPTLLTALLGLYIVL